MRKKHPWRKWQLWTHYVLLMALVYIGTRISVNNGLEDWFNSHYITGFLFQFLYYYLWYSLGDQLIHFTLRVTTGWED